VKRLPIAVLLAAFAGLALGCPRREPPASGPAEAGTAPELAPPSASTSEPPAPSAPEPAAFAERRDERNRLVRSIERQGVRDPVVLAAMRRVPRHAFVPNLLQSEAYEDRPLPIGSGQTISQPYIVAFMTEAVSAKRTDKCLEIGTGSGYQAAVLAEVCEKTYSIEYLPELAERAKDTLRRLGYGADRIELRTGDGYAGWREAAPFDVVMVTAAPETVPQPLLDQLAMGGRLVIPVGPSPHDQALERYRRVAPGRAASAFVWERLLDVRFVPFLGR
jgi:protein-L-isoaspartate(D-aspartate) O-methyltransferase